MVGLATAAVLLALLVVIGSGLIVFAQRSMTRMTREGQNHTQVLED